MADEEVDHERLERALKALGYTVRLQLLSILRTPRTLDEIEVSPAKPDVNGLRSRPMSRQALQEHLDRLVEAGFVQVRNTRRKGTRAQQEYVLEHRRLFAAVDELRQLTTLQSRAPLDSLRTMEIDASGEGPEVRGPCLVLTRGVHEGQTYALDHAPISAERGWVIGRAERVDVPLTYDPYVSAENAEIVRLGNEYRLLDLRSARNRVSLNWQPLGRGEHRALHPGDIIGVGRSLLVFRNS